MIKECKPRLFDDSTKHSRVCNFCFCDIFNACYHCPICEEADFCLNCIADGRGCQHKYELQAYQYLQANVVNSCLKEAKNVYKTLKQREEFSRIFYKLH